jgi:hypothetical protein
MMFSIRFSCLVIACIGGVFFSPPPAHTQTADGAVPQSIQDLIALLEQERPDPEKIAIPWMAATLDGVVAGTGAVYEAKFMLPWSFSEEFAAEKYMAQLQHNMWMTNARMAALSIITGGGKWVEISIAADPLYQHLLLTAEKKFWPCVSFGEPPRRNSFAARYRHTFP